MTSIHSVYIHQFILYDEGSTVTKQSNRDRDLIHNHLIANQVVMDQISVSPVCDFLSSFLHFTSAIDLTYGGGEKVI